MPPRSNANERRAKPPAGDRFGADYYRRFYADPRTRVSDLAAVQKLADFVGGYLRYLEVPVRTILDVGCGVGNWQKASKKVWPRARYHGLEYSQHLCDRFGWTHGSIVDFEATSLRPDGTFDFVVCQGVLQYLDDRAATAAIDNLGAMCSGALYLEALTELDWRENCDRARTDGNVHLRTGTWYRKRLRKHFLDCGGGLFCSRAAGVSLFELEGS